MQMFIVQLGDMPGPKSLEFEFARWVSPSLAAYAFLLASISIFYEQINAFRIRFAKNHVIICGLGEKSLMLSKKFIEQKKNYKLIIVEVNPENEHIDTMKSLGVCVVIGNANDENTLRQIGAEKADHLFVLCGNDGVNAEISVLANDIKKDGDDLKCYIHISDNKLCNFFQINGLSKSSSKSIKVDYFNFFHIGAYSMMRKFPFNYSSDGKNGALIVGLGKIGENILIDLVYRWKTRENPFADEKFKIVVVDVECGDKLEMIKAKNPLIEKICEIIPVQVNIRSAQFYKAAFIYSGDKTCFINKAYVCLNSDSDSLLAALTLDCHLEKYGVEIAVCMSSNNGLATMFKKSKICGKNYERIKIMGLLDEVCVPDIVIGGNYERLARSIHEEYCKKEKAKGHTVETNPMVIEWDGLPEEYKDSNRRQARSSFDKLEKAGYNVTIMTDLVADKFEFHKDDIEIMAKYEHQIWMEEKLKKGWRYGPVRDNDKKIHPSLKAYDKLDEEEKQKDRDTVTDLPKHLAMIGLQIYKETIIA